MSSSPRRLVPGQPHDVTIAGHHVASDGARLLWLADLIRGVESSTCALHQLTLLDDVIRMIVTPPSAGSLSVLLARTFRGASPPHQATPLPTDRAWIDATLTNDSAAYRRGLVPAPSAHIWSTAPLHAGHLGSRVSPWIWTPAPWYVGLARSANARAAIYAGLLDRHAHAPDFDEATTGVFDRNCPETLDL